MNLFRLDAIECPSCSATLRNVSISPGQKISCLNCGNRFAPPAVPAPNVEAVAGAEAPLQPPGVALTTVPSIQSVRSESGSTPVAPGPREPRGAGYWILRIPAMVLAFAAFLGFAIGSVSMLVALLGNLRGNELLAMLMFSSYMPLAPSVGVLLVLVTRSLAKTETAALQTGWKLGLILQPLPAARGSDLPYIGPLMVCGGAGLIYFTVTAAKGNLHSAPAFVEILGFSIAPILCALVAFMSADLRQFIWRQQRLAEALNKPVVRRSRLLPAALGVVAALPLLFLCISTLTSISETVRQMNDPAWWGFGMAELEQPLVFMILVLLALLGSAVTACLLGWGIGTAVELWDAAGGASTFRRMFDFVSLALCAAALCGGACIAAFFIGLAVLEFNQDDRQLSYLVGALGAILGVLAVMVVLFAAVRNWRRAQEDFWLSRCPGMLRPSLSWFQWIVTLLPAGLFFIQTPLLTIQVLTLLGGSISAREEFRIVSGIATLYFSIHFPIVWMVLISREFLLAERNAEAAAKMVGGRLA